MVLVPFGPLRWYRLVRYDGTDCSATVVPIRPLRWYRLTDTINMERTRMYTKNKEGRKARNYQYFSSIEHPRRVFK